jgi:predicted SprT family Zn-dependent metalloprotease
VFEIKNRTIDNAEKHNNYICNLYCSSNIIKKINLSSVRKIVNVCIHCGGKMEGKEHLEDVICVDSVKMNL